MAPPLELEWVLTAQEHFLAKSTPDLTTWEELVPGRAAVLRTS